MSGQEWQAKSVFCDNAPNRIKVFVAGWKGKQIADCGVETPDTIADARLIAAAPELLSIAKCVFEELNGLNATMRATNKEYSASALCEVLSGLVKDASEVFGRVFERVFGD